MPAEPPGHDPAGPRDGGRDGALLRQPGARVPVERWTLYDGCEPGPDEAVAAEDYDNAVFGSETTTRVWGACDDGAAVGLWTLLGSGHVPGMNADFVPDALAFLLTHLREDAAE